MQKCMKLYHVTTHIIYYDLLCIYVIDKLICVHRTDISFVHLLVMHFCHMTKCDFLQFFPMIHISSHQKFVMSQPEMSHNDM